MNKDEIFIDGIRKYICVGYTETERPIYELNPEYENYIKSKSPQNLPKADAYSLLYEVAPKTEIRDPDTLHRYYMCPNSKCFGGFKAIKRDFEYCPYCGVKLSWRNFL